MSKQVFNGVVVGVSNDKTAKVKVVTTQLNKLYGRVVRTRKNYQVHDPSNLCAIGSEVTIIQCRPMSATKRFELLSINKEINK